MENKGSPEYIVVGTASLESSGSHTGTRGLDTKRCTECQKSYKSCDCKSCAKCGSTFMKYFATGTAKGRSHCRICGQAVCFPCLVLVGGTKVCTRCHLKQKEDEISTEEALSAIEKAKYGEKKVDYPSYAKLKFGDNREDVLFEAAKKGDDHIMVTILNMGLDVNSRDGDNSTALFYAAEGGHLSCVALLLERGSNVSCTNNSGWTPLHAVAWKGSTDFHVECAKMLLEMGADALAENATNETAADLAERCGGKKEIIHLLRGAEVEISVKELKDKVESLLASGLKERRLCRMITALLNFISSSRISDNLAVQGVAKLLLPPENLVKSASFDKGSIKKTNCPNCGASSPLKGTTKFGGSLEIIRPKADVEPMVRNTEVSSENQASSQAEHAENQSLPVQAKLLKYEAEKKDWEMRCRKLMQSIAVSSREHKKRVDELESQVSMLRDENDSDIKKIEAAYGNKLAKVRREADSCIREIQAVLTEAEDEKRDLLHIQSNYKLTWVPDEIVQICQNAKCRAPFTATTRKHHCRCCGRIFCNNCSSVKSDLILFGYDRPVRMCNTCFALVDDYISDDPLTKPSQCTI